MTTKIIDGKRIAEELRGQIGSTISQLVGRRPSLAVIIVGNNTASRIYVNAKRKACETVGITSHLFSLSEDVNAQDLITLIHQLNRQEDIDGILLQLPLPSHLVPTQIIREIDPNKDVDGLHPLNAGKLLLGESDGFVPCTPLGIQHLLIETLGSIAGKKVLILGRSSIVGKPLAALLLQNNRAANATVTIAHSKSEGIADLCREADILIAAMGHPLFIKGEMIKQGAVLIDVGISRIPDPTTPKGYRIVGDIDLSSVESICSAYTPVPGGVGPMTIAMLLHNTLLSYQRRNNCSSHSNSR